MKEIAIIILTLFSFSSQTKYEVEEYSCESNEIRVKYEDTWYNLSLFNINIKDDIDVCSYIGGSVQIEFDPLVKIDNPLNAYLFIDGTLLQQTLIDNEQADIKIANPKYKYQLENKNEKVMKEVENKQKVKKQSSSKKMAFVFIGIWVLLCIILLVLKVRKRNRNLL